MYAVRVFWKAMKWVATDGTRIKHGLGKEIEPKGPSQARLGTDLGETKMREMLRVFTRKSAKFHETPRKFAQIRAVVTRCLASQARHKLGAPSGLFACRNVVALLRVGPIFLIGRAGMDDTRKDEMNRNELRAGYASLIKAAWGLRNLNVGRLRLGLLLDGARQVNRAFSGTDKQIKKVMNFKITTPKTLLLFILLAGSEMARGQGTVFTYQGRFLDGGSPANGTNYDIRFSLYDASINGNQLANLQATGVPISNGLFAVPLNFGQQPFSGSNLWLELAVQKNGGGLLILSARKQLTPTPYAIMANTASNLAGPLPPTALSGVYSGAVSFTNGGNTFAGSHTGNGGGLTNLNASQLTNGTVPDARLSTNVELLHANEPFIGAVHFTVP